MTTTPHLGLDSTEGLELSRARRAKPPSLKPALIVLACAVVVTFGGLVVSLVESGTPAKSVVTGLGTPVPGVNLSAVSAAQVLRRISSGGTPPSDILTALVVPDQARILSTTSQDAGVDQYDRSISFQVDTKSSELVKFYVSELKRANWSLLGTYPLPGSATEVLARKSSSDGYQWEVGVVVTPVNPSISPSLAGGGQTSPVMGLRLRLFEVPDSS